MPEPNHIQIGEVAERTGSPLRTIRYYGEVGSMEPSARSRGGFLLHTETDVDRSVLIERRRPLGFGLEEMCEPLERLDRPNSAENLLQERKPLSEGLDASRRPSPDFSPRHLRPAVGCSKPDGFHESARSPLRGPCDQASRPRRSAPTCCPAWSWPWP